MRWPPYRHVFFDCDSTLTRTEGIDALADRVGQGARVKALTDAAMGGEVELEDVYGERLDAISATRGDVGAIREVYKKNVVEDAGGVIDALHTLGHEVYIISGGLIDPVREFGVHLGVAAQHIRAVGVEYDELSGDWWSQAASEHAKQEQRYLAYQAGPLSVSDGKARIVSELLGGQGGSSLLVGDGVSDLLARRAVDLFLGFGGVETRTRVAQEAPAFLKSPSLAPVLALAAGPAAIARVSGPHAATFQKAFRLISAGALVFNDEALQSKFSRAYDAQRACANNRQAD